LTFILTLCLVLTNLLFRLPHTTEFLPKFGYRNTSLDNSSHRKRRDKTTMGPQPAVSAEPGPSRPLAMVSLDGGGVRGLSSLLILRLLLVLITEELVRRQVMLEDDAALNPQDIFDIAVGTSTGGLIVLMMVKLNMSLDECIEQYKVLSADIFSKRRPILKRIFGSDWSKFSGKRLQKAVEKLLASRGEPHDMKLRCSPQPNGMQG